MNFHYSLIKCRNTSNSRNSTFQDMPLKKTRYNPFFKKENNPRNPSTSRNNQILYSYLDLSPQPPLR